MPTETRRAIARCIREQRRCLRYLKAHGFTKPPGYQSVDGGTAAAWMGLCDWMMEEVLLRAGI